MKKLLFLYNTHAGKGLLKNRLAAVQDALAAAGWDVTIHPTQGAGDATAVAAARAGEFDRIVCSGGDGTLHEVVAGLMGLENRPEVGYIPAGTTNDFAKNLSLPRGMEAMARVAAAGVPRPVDIGSFNDRYFIYVAAFGAFTEVAYDTPQELKNTFGHLAYVMAGIASLPSITPYHLKLEYDGQTIEDDFFYGMVCNTYSVGGIKNLPTDRVDLDDGLFEVILVRKPMNIFDIGAGQPAKLPQLRRFLNYYLPTTLKLLNAYDRMGAAGVEGANIDGTMGRIDAMMDKVVEAFDKQLDALFADEALDISTDITVLEQMLAQEGLGGMQMGQS